MKIKRIDTFRLFLLTSAALFYLLITGELHWLTYVLLGLIVFERIVIAFVLWMVGRVQRDAAKKLMEAIAQAQAQGHAVQPPFDQGDM